MVAVQVTNEDVVESRELEPHAAHLELGALATVDHEEVAAHIKYLARRQVSKSGSG